MAALGDQQAEVLRRAGHRRRGVLGAEGPHLPGRRDQVDPNSSAGGSSSWRRRTNSSSFGVPRLEPPAEEFRIDLVAPSGEVWSYGPEDAAQTLTGSAYDFCLLVTQRAHRDDLDLVGTGPDVDRWLGIAQAFAGPSGKGREATAG